VCQREPLYYGGRGQECQPCSEAGDPTTTIGLAIGGTVAALVVLAALVIYFKQRVLDFLTKMAEVASLNESSSEAVKGVLARQSQSEVSRRNQRMGRLLELAGSVGVKARILISLAQVLSQITTTYSITFPSLYTKMLAAIDRVNFPVKFLPFACIFPDLDNYMFDLVLQTGTPLCASHSVGL
jgi:hypothetical protein